VVVSAFGSIFRLASDWMTKSSRGPPQQHSQYHVATKPDLRGGIEANADSRCVKTNARVSARGGVIHGSRLSA